MRSPCPCALRTYSSAGHSLKSRAVWNTLRASSLHHREDVRVRSTLLSNLTVRWGFLPGCGGRPAHPLLTPQSPAKSPQSSLQKAGRSLSGWEADAGLLFQGVLHTRNTREVRTLINSAFPSHTVGLLGVSHRGEQLTRDLGGWWSNGARVKGRVTQDEEKSHPGCGEARACTHLGIQVSSH